MTDCIYAKQTGDTKYPVLCDKDMRYCNVGYCAKCPERREP